MLSVVVITLNEEQNLGRCLGSVAAIADEIVVVDSGSTDGTEAVARSFGARWVRQDWLGHRAQKQAALELATGDWVLSLDADEWLEADAAAAVAGIDGSADGYVLQRWTRFLGRPVHAWSPEPVLRLARRDRARFGGLDPHDRLVVDGDVAVLDARLEHDSYGSWAQYRRRSRRYAAIAGASAHAAGKRFSWGRLVVSPLAAALRRWFGGGWRDGWRGLAIAWGTADYARRKQWALRAAGQGSLVLPASEHAGRVDHPPNTSSRNATNA